MREILGWSAADFTAYKRRLNGPGTRQLNDYAQICAEMSREYKQWSSNLLLAWDGTGAKGNYLAPYSPQNMPEAAKPLASRRMAYLNSVYDLLPQEELDGFGELLSPSYLASGGIPDVKAAYVLYQFEDVFKLAHESVGANAALIRNFRHATETTGSPVTDFTRFLADKMLAPVLATTRENRDSLPARLLLNAAINRACPENAELTRTTARARCTTDTRARTRAPAPPDWFAYTR